MRWTQRILLAAAFTALAFTQAVAQNSLVIVTGAEAPMPIPTLMEGGQAVLPNYEISDHLFLRLAGPGPDADDRRRRRLRSVAGQVLDPTRLGDAGFRARPPRALARRRAGDRARRAVHHGPGAEPRDRAPRREAPSATSRRSRRRASGPWSSASPARTPSNSTTRPFTRRCSPRTFLPRCRRTASRARRSFRTRSATARTAGSAACPGELVELAANDQFFLGRPSIQRLIVRVAKDADARLNMVLSGEADAMDNLSSPRHQRSPGRGPT